MWALWARAWGMGGRTVGMLWGHCGDGDGDIIGDSCRDTAEAGVGTLWEQLWEGGFRADNSEHCNTGVGWFRFALSPFTPALHKPLVVIF